MPRPGTLERPLEDDMHQTEEVYVRDIEVLEQQETPRIPKPGIGDFVIRQGLRGHISLGRRYHISHR